MKRFLFFTVCILLMCVNACKKDVDPNPYDPYKNPPVDSSKLNLLPAASFPGLYQQVFKPVCANSGCHDGTFEPDFRTIESSYNSLVYHSIIKNDIGDPLQYRVHPGNVAKSMIVRRLTIDLNGNSGIMPLVVDPGSDWNAKKDANIENIKQWIADGAKDISGNAANGINKVPQINGMMITAAGGSTPFSRDIEGAVLVPGGTNAVDIYFAVSDAETAGGSLTISASKFSIARDDFATATLLSSSVITPVTFTGYGGTQTSFYYKVTVPDLSAYWQDGNRVFVSLTVTDGTNTVSLPGHYAIDHIKSYYSFRIN